MPVNSERKLGEIGICSADGRFGSICACRRSGSSRPDSTAADRPTMATRRTHRLRPFGGAIDLGPQRRASSSRRPSRLSEPPPEKQMPCYLAGCVPNMPVRAKQGQEWRRTPTPRRIALRQGLRLIRSAILLARRTTGVVLDCARSPSQVSAGANGRHGCRGWLLGKQSSRSAVGP